MSMPNADGTFEPPEPVYETDGRTCEECGEPAVAGSKLCDECFLDITADFDVEMRRDNM